MSIILLQQPNKLEYVYNPFYFHLSGSNSSHYYYKYVLDIYCSSSILYNYTDVSVGRFKFAPSPTDGTAFISPASILASFVHSSLNVTATTIASQNSPAIGYQINIGEEYSLSSTSAATIYASLTAITNNYAINAVRQYENPHILSQYDGINHIAGILTDWDWNNTKQIYEAEWETGAFFTSSTNYPINRININTYTADGNIYGSYQLTATTIISPARFVIPLGTLNLSGITAHNNISNATDTIINSNVDTYQINCSSYSGGFDVQQTIDWFFQICRCTTRFPKIRIAWLNSLGGFDFYTFNQMHQTLYTRKNNEWQKILSPNYIIGDRGRTVLNVEANRKLVVNSDWLDNIYSTFVENIFKSTEWYWIKDDGSRIPLILTTKDFESKTVEQNQLFQYVFEFDFANDVIAQRS